MCFERTTGVDELLSRDVLIQHYVAYVVVACLQPYGYVCTAGLGTRSARR
jgi:hypothetical protein